MGSSEFFDSLFSDADSDADFIKDPNGKKGKEKMVLSAEMEAVEKFCRSNKIDEKEFFASAFGYTVSRFTGYQNSILCVEDGGKIVPCLFGCGNRPVSEFLKKSSENIRLCSKHIESVGVDALKEKYSIRTNVIFAFGKSNATLKHDVKLSVSEKGNVEISHSEKMSPFVAERVLSSFDMIVSGFLTKKMLSEIEYVSETDLKKADEMNENAHRLKHKNILDAFAKAVKKHPGKVLVTYEDKTFTYEESDRISDFVSDCLAKSGVKHGDRVSVFVSRSEMYLLSALGVLKAGGAYVPIDENHPDERVEFMISDSSSKAIISDSTMKERAEKISSSTGVPVIYVSSSNRSEKKIKPTEIAPKDGSVILYTSGTTGKPKGSFITHLALINLCEWYVDNSGLTSDDVMGLYTSFSFDMHAMGIFPPIVAGSSLDVIPQKIRLDMRLLGDHIKERRITHCFMTTHVGKMYMSSEFHRIEKLYLAGEKLGEFRSPEGTVAYDGYGPSENIALTTAAIVNEKKDPSSVGVLNYNMKAYVLDAEKRRVPFGAVGELFISGYQLSLGYLNREDANKKSFFKNPYSDEKWYDRIYASGDFFRYLPDGTFGFIGRRDGQVKIRGNRVELTEVEAAVREIKGVKDATVQAIVNSFGAKELCAYIVSDGKVSEKEVQDHIGKTKPAFMIPYSVVELEKIPLNTNGKVDKNALPKPFVGDERKGEKPKNELEKKICEIFAQVLNKKEVFADDNFFSIGGTSISAIKVIQECFKKKIDITYGILFENPTPRKLAEYKPGEIARRKWNPPEFLGKNRIENVKGKIQPEKLGRVFLAGANGFLGSHVLRELLDEGAEYVYCLVKHAETSSEKKFEKTMKHYFPKGFSGEESKKIEIVDANVNDPNLASILEKLDFDMIINCAAVVKYFAVGDRIAKVNVDGAVALAEIAMKKKARFVHASTISTIGSKTKNTPDVKYGETMLDYGQGIPNMYVSSKMEAEKKIMEMMENGLDAKILRFGNLMPRWSDGKFQPNAGDNGYMMMLDSVAKFGYVADSDIGTDLTQVDCAAKAAVLLSRTPSDYTVFHVYNNKFVKATDLVDSMKSHGAKIVYVGKEEFYEKFYATLENNPDALSNIIPFLNTSSDKNERGVECYDCVFTAAVLEKLGFEWPSANQKYLDEITKIAMSRN